MLPSLQIAFGSIKCFGNRCNKMEWMCHTIHTSHVDHWHANKAPDPNNSLDVGNVFRRFSFFACLAVQVLLMVFSICCSIVALGGHCCFLCSSKAATSAHFAGHYLLLASWYAQVCSTEILQGNTNLPWNLIYCWLHFENYRWSCMLLNHLLHRWFAKADGMLLPLLQPILPQQWFMAVELW